MDWFWSPEALAGVLLNFVKEYPEHVLVAAVAALVVLAGEIGARIKPGKSGVE